MCQHVAVANGQPPFVGQRHHLPVGAVHVEHHLLLVGAQLRIGQRGLVLGNVFVSLYLATHVERLCQQYHARRHVAGVGAESIGNALAKGIASLSQCRGILLKRPRNVLNERCQVGVFGNDLLCYGWKLCAKLVNRSRTDVVERVLLVIVEQ